VKFRLSSTMMLAGQFAEAKALLLPLVEDDGADLGSINSNLATILFFEGDFDGAAGLYLDAIELEPEDPLYYRNLGDAIWHGASPEEAEPTFVEAVRLAKRQLSINPDDSYALSSLMVSAASLGDVDAYLRAKKKLAEKWGSDPQTQYDFAIAASRLGEMEVAQNHARQAYELGYPVAFLRADPDIAASGANF